MKSRYATESEMGRVADYVCEQITHWVWTGDTARLIECACEGFATLKIKASRSQARYAVKLGRMKYRGVVAQTKREVHG
jgi:hypothetical protein